MPELPEVETIRRQLEKFIVGHKIINVQINYGKKFEGDPKIVIGAKIKSVLRFGKVLEIELSNTYTIVIHVKMTGQLIYRGPNLSTKTQLLSTKVIGGVPGKHTHVIFHLDRGGVLYYNDVRKFGWIKMIKSSKLKTQNQFIGKLGPEPHVAIGSAGQAFLTFDLFKNMLSSSKRPVKLLLMDQEKIAGVGNIYANDALWLAKVHPRRISASLSFSEQKELLKAIETVLKKGIKYGGSSENSYVTPDGSEGNYQHHTLIYGKEGKLCERPACWQAGVIIEKFFLSGRGTYICPFCQKT